MKMKSSDFRIPSASEMQERVFSQLVIERDSVLFCLETAPLEIYLASDLQNRFHWRESRLMSEDHHSLRPLMRNCAAMSIPADKDCHVDKLTDTLSVVRSTSTIFQRHNLKAHVFEVLLFCANNGEISRRHEESCSRVMDFGIKAEIQTENHDMLVYGQKYFQMIEKEKLRQEIHQSLGNIVDFIWRTSNEIQKDLKHENPQNADPSCPKCM